MTAPAIAVAVGFGLTVGWGMGFSLTDRRPPLLALLTGIVAGVVILAASLGPDPELAGWSLILGCGAGLLSFSWKTWR